MNDEPQGALISVRQQPNPVGIIEGDCQKEPGMSLKKHKRLTDLAYRVKDFIDGNGGLTYEESCQFGQIMQSIINLK